MPDRRHHHNQTTSTKTPPNKSVQPTPDSLAVQWFLCLRSSFVPRGRRLTLVVGLLPQHHEEICIGQVPAPRLVVALHREIVLIAMDDDDRILVVPFATVSAIDRHGNQQLRTIVEQLLFGHRFPITDRRETTAIRRMIRSPTSRSSRRRNRWRLSVFLAHQTASFIRGDG